MHARRQSQAHKRIAANVSTPPRPRGSSDATSVKPQSSCSTPPAAAPTRSPTRPRLSPASPLRSRRHCFVVCEATGPLAPYERDLLAALASPPASPRPAEPTPARSRPSSASFGTLGKSDAIDANALARYGLDRYAERPLWSAREPERERLQALVLARRDLVKDRLAYANRRAAPAAEPVHPYLQALVESFDAQINAIEADIKTSCAPRVSRSPRPSMSWSPYPASVKTAAALIALVPELGSLPRRRAAALAGLAPTSQSKRPDRRLSPNPRRKTRSQTSPVHGRNLRRKNTTRPSAPSTNVSSAQAKSPSSPSPQSCENSSLSRTPNSEQQMLFK